LYFQTSRFFILIDLFQLRGREALTIVLLRNVTYGATMRENLVVAFLFELLVPFVRTGQLPILEARFQVKTSFFRFSSFFLLTSRYSSF